MFRVMGGFGKHSMLITTIDNAYAFSQRVDLPKA